jgi:Zn finger protein HypA/HybF involved in hydrogenase expression
LQHTAQPAHAEGAQHQQQQQQQQQQQPVERRPERNCWQCGTPLTAKDLFFCPGCHSVQPASMDMQYFKVFDM